MLDAVDGMLAGAVLEELVLNVGVYSMLAKFVDAMFEAVDKTLLLKGLSVNVGAYPVLGLIDAAEAEKLLGCSPLESVALSVDGYTVPELVSVEEKTLLNGALLGSPVLNVGAVSAVGELFAGLVEEVGGEETSVELMGLLEKEAENTVEASETEAGVEMLVDAETEFDDRAVLAAELDDTDEPLHVPKAGWQFAPQ